MHKQVYGVQVIAFPEGALDQEGLPVPGWEPEGWAEKRAKLRREGVMSPGEDEFFWPKTDKLYLSKATARARVRLLEGYGAKARVVAAELQWKPVEVFELDRKIEQSKSELNALELRRISATIAALPNRPSGLCVEVSDGDLS